MSEENVEIARRGYAVLNDAYRSGDVDDFAPFAEQFWDPEFEFHTTTWPESGVYRGREGGLRFVAQQMEAFSGMWMEPQEFIEAGDKVVVPIRFGGRARHTGIEVEASRAHVWTMRDGKAVLCDVFETKEEALEAAGLRE